MTRFSSRLAVMALMTVAPLSAAAAQGLTAIRAGRLVDVERGEVRRDQILLVRGTRIEAVLPASAKLPTEARLVDLSRYTVLPGLIDCHAHLVGDAAGADVLLPLERSEAQEAFSGVRNARATLLAVHWRGLGTHQLTGAEVHLELRRRWAVTAGVERPGYLLDRFETARA